MLLREYASIVFTGLYDSPNFLLNHLKRELKKVKDKGYDENEFEHDLTKVLTIMKDHIENLYSKDLKTFEEYAEMDKQLPKEKRYNYPKPNLNGSSFTRIILKDERYTFDLPKPITYDDLRKVETALAELMSNKESKLNVNGFTCNENSAAFYSEKIEEIRNKFRIKRIATKADVEECPRLSEGEESSQDPIPQSTAEAYKYLTEYYSAIYCESNKQAFIGKYKVWKPELIKAELNELESFIENANKESISNAYDSFGKYNDKDEFVYLRLLHGFYEHLNLNRYPIINSIGNPEAVIYGRYFLFKDFLIEQLKNFPPAIQLKKTEEEFLLSDGLSGLVELLNNSEEIKNEQLNSGFNKLEEYIIKNVHEDVRADLPRLEQLKRNLINWKGQLRAVFIEPENQSHDDLEFFKAMKANAERMENKIERALEVLGLRIMHKVSENANPEKEDSSFEWEKKHFENLRQAFNSVLDYKKAVNAIAAFFSGKPLKITSPIFVKNGNIKNLAFALGEIWRSQRNDIISYEYLMFYKNTFSIFSKQKIDKKNLFGNNLYKYSISKT